MKNTLLTVCLCLAGQTLVADPVDPVVISTKGITTSIGTSMLHLTDTAGNMTVPQVLASDGFQPCINSVPSFGLTRYAHWLRFDLRNATEEPTLLVAIPYPGIDELDVFMDPGNGFERIVRAGLSRDASEATSTTKDLIFELPVPRGGTATVLMRLRGFKHLHAPVVVGTATAVNLAQTNRYIAVGAYIGVMLVLFLYNFFVFISTRDRHYLFYVLSILALCCTQLTLQGQGPFNFFHVNGWLTARAGLLFNLAAIPFGYEFARRFMNTRQHVPKMDRWVPLIYGLLAVIAVVYLFDPWIGQEMGNSISGMAALYLLTMGILSFRKGSRQAGFFLLAWSAFLVGVVLFVLKDESVIPYDAFTVYAMPIGSAIEGVLLSFGLADRINILRKEKEASQAEALNASRENERIIREQNMILEEKVQERTHALQESNEHLKRTQTQLVNAEKMASLGQLTAGIAHEINNPINFITSNIAPLRRNISEIVEVIEGYRAINAENAAERIKALKEREDKLGLEESINELDGIMDSIAEGSSRTAEIVRGLRNFSRLDEDDLKESDVNEGLRSTLAVLAPQFRDKVHIDMQLEDVPLVECYPGKVNQVFMNILTNAVQATLARADNKAPKIRITTGMHGDHVVVSIKDNGIGMTEEVKARMYDPFFTTKAVGEGTGLGLAIVYGIIQDHQGSITVDSTVGQGTEFRILLPLRHVRMNERRA